MQLISPILNIKDLDKDEERPMGKSFINRTLNLKKSWIISNNDLGIEYNVPGRQM